MILQGKNNHSTEKEFIHFLLPQRRRKKSNQCLPSQGRTLWKNVSLPYKQALIFFITICLPPSPPPYFTVTAAQRVIKRLEKYRKLIYLRSKKVCLLYCFYCQYDRKARKKSSFPFSSLQVIWYLCLVVFCFFFFFI